MFVVDEGLLSISMLFWMVPPGANLCAPLRIFFHVETRKGVDCEAQRCFKHEWYHRDRLDWEPLDDNFVKELAEKWKEEKKEELI
jgi:hypothetical protein